MNARWIHSTVYDPTLEQMAKAKEDFAQAGMLGFPTVGTMPSTAEAILLNSKLKLLVAQSAYDPFGEDVPSTRNMRTIWTHHTRRQ